MAAPCGKSRKRKASTGEIGLSEVVAINEGCVGEVGTARNGSESVNEQRHVPLVESMALIAEAPASYGDIDDHVLVRRVRV